MKKFLAILVSIMLVLSLSVFAFAEEGDPTSTSTVNDSITITGAKEGETYNLYKLFDLVVNDESNPTAYSYTVNSAWADFFAPAVEADPDADPPVAAVEAGPGAQYVTINDEGYVTAISDAAALATAADEWANKPAATQSVTVAEGETTAVFSNLPDGYWLISSTLGTARMTETTPDASAVTIAEKNPEDTVEKQVQEDSTSTWGETNDAQIGDTVYFQSTVTLLPNTTNVVYHDTMDAGLTFNTGSVAIDGLTEGTDYTVNESPDGETFTVTFTQAYLDTLTESTDVVITYNAVLDEDAIVVDTTTGEPSIDSQTNEAHLTFGDNQETTHETTETDTHKFAVNKYADGIADLAGAVFQLKKNGTVVPLVQIDDCNYRVANPGESATTTNTFTSVDSGDIVIWGVDADSDYAIEELTPPDGYNSISGDISVEVDADNSLVVDVENQSGSELPSTGGIGTTIFYIIGAVLVLGAAIILIAKRRSAVTEA